MEYYIGQIFEGKYPPEDVVLCKVRNGNLLPIDTPTEKMERCERLGKRIYD